MKYLPGTILILWLIALITSDGHPNLFWKIGLVIYLIALITYAETQDYHSPLA